MDGPNSYGVLERHLRNQFENHSLPHVLQPSIGYLEEFHLSLPFLCSAFLAIFEEVFLAILTPPFCLRVRTPFNLSALSYLSVLLITWEV